MSIQCVNDTELHITCEVACEAESGLCISCGDGRLSVELGEACDDGNDDNTDDCVECRFPVCGDGFTQTGVEGCDDGALNSDTTPNACRTFCGLPVCGD